MLGFTIYGHIGHTSFGRIGIKLLLVKGCRGPMRFRRTLKEVEVELIGFLEICRVLKTTLRGFLGFFKGSKRTSVSSVL